MLKMKLEVIVFLMLTTSLLNAQDFDFGKISKAELEEKFSPIDSTASAEYLYKYRKTFFEYVPEVGFSLVTNIHERIKIYNKKGFDYATKKIALYKEGSSREGLSKIKAKTYNLIENKIEETPLKKDGQFEVEISEDLDELSFTMPNIKEGSIIEYKYDISSPFISSVDEFVFQHDIPVRKLNAIFDSPQYFNFRLNVKGFLRVIPKKERFNRTLNYSERVTSGGVDGTGAGLGLGKTTLKKSVISYFSDVTTYGLNNVPPLKDEPYVNELNNYRSGVKYELSYTDFPNSEIKYYSTTWEDVVKTIYKSSNFGEELKKTTYFKKDIEELLAGVKDNQEKMLKIFTFMKSKVKWNNFYGKYTRDGVKKAYKDGVGNVAEINLMLTAMLNYAGFEANPVLVSTRTNGIPLFPTRQGYNYVVSSVEINDDVVLLDASSQNSSPGVLPFRALNWEGRIINKDGGSKIIGLYPNTKSSTKVFLNANLKVDGEIEGKVRTLYSDHQAMAFRNSYSTNEEEDYLRNLEEENDGIEINSFDIKNATDLLKSPIISYDYFYDKGMDIVGGKIYFSPLLFFGTKENPFKLESREFPIDFSYPFVATIVSNLIMPEGYKIDFLPEPVVLVMPDELGSFKFDIKNNGEIIQLKVIKVINQPVLPSHYYPVLKEFYKKMIEKMNEKVVLSRIEE